jgi:proline iminopeptidase
MSTSTRSTRPGEEPLVTSRTAAAAPGSPRQPQPQPFDVATSDGTIAVRARGGSGETVVLLHGGPGCPDYLQPVAQLLPAHLRVVTFDQRGVGGSAGARTFTLEDYLSDIEAVRRHLDVEQIHLLGHSWGGLLAQVYANKFPQRVASMVLTNSAAGVGNHWRQVEREVMAYNRRRSGPAGFAVMGLWAALMVLPGRVGNVAGRRLLRRVWRNYFHDNASAPSADVAWLGGSSRTAAVKTTAAIRAANTDMLDGLGSRLGVPVLLVYGEHDIYGASKALLETRFAPAHHVTILKQCGHLPWLQAPGDFASLLRDFYSTAAPATEEVPVSAST